MSESRRKKRTNAKINNILLIVLLVAMVLTIVAFVLNMNRINKIETGEGETIEETALPENEYNNEYYSIGYNATEINKEYFRQLDDEVEAALLADTGETSGTAVRDNQAIASSVVKCFITEYYTWTNKDGNYDIGGMQYIFKDRIKDFEKYTRYNFYADLDLYLTQYDRNQLIQVKDVTVNEIYETDRFWVEETGSELECWAVDALWTYEEDTVMDISEIQSSAEFLVVNHDGRLEIAAIDKPEEEETYYDETEWGY